MKCKYCEGSGVIVVPNGPDDYDLEICKCKIYGKTKNKNKGIYGKIQRTKQGTPQRTECTVS
jgi:hypothetical protein